MSELLDKPAGPAGELIGSAPSATRTQPGRRSIVSILWWAVDLATLIVAGAALAGYCGRLGWLFELASHFRWQYGVLLAASSLCYLAGRRWRAGLAAGFLSAANLCLVLSIGAPAPKPEGRTVVRAVLCNVLSNNQDHQRLLAFLRETSPDLVVLVEVSFDWAATLHALDAAYPYRRVSPANRGWGMALFSRLPLDDVEQTLIGGDLFLAEDTGRSAAEGNGRSAGGTGRSAGGTGSSAGGTGRLAGGTGRSAGGTGSALAIVARLQIDGQPLTVIGTHPWSPVAPSKLEFRNRQFTDLAALVRRQREPVVLLADLNASPWSPYFQDLLSASGLRDSRQGFGIQASWPARYPFARIPIDHCLVSPEIAIHQRTIGPNLGSDHFPVVVDFFIGSE